MFTVCLITSNFFVPRLWQVGHTGFQLSGAVLLFPVSYILNDCLTEVYGYRKSRLVIWLAFALSAFVAVMSQIVCCLPAPAEESSRQVAEHFNSLFAMVPRTTIASLLAFICGSTCNAWIMSKMKVLNKGRYFGLRAILSSIGGELLDSLIFFPFVFWGIMDLQTILKLVFTQVVVKTSYELVILPATSWFVKYTKKKEGIDTYDESISYNPFKFRDDYAPEVLETFINKHQGNDYWVRFNCPEFTSLCPITGQPDFAEIRISYIPDVKMVESKSLKLYLFSFRNHGDFHEDCVNKIMKDLISLMDPKYIEVTGLFTPRGGISIYPYANYGRPGTKYEALAEQRFAQHQ